LRRCDDRAVKVETPFGEYPFEFRRLERRGATVAIVGIVFGLETSVVFDRDDLTALARRSALPIAAALALAVFLRRRV
jgi:hypothetical protein